MTPAKQFGKFTNLKVHWSLKLSRHGYCGLITAEIAQRSEELNQ